MRPEFLNRVDEIITFNSLSENDFAKIAGIMLEDLKKALEEKHLQLTVSSEAVELIAKRSYSRQYGARNMRRFIQREVEDRLAELIIADYKKSYSVASVSVDGEGLRVSCL